MTLLQRFGYFGIGLFIGIIFLIFFLSGKKTSCDYSPNARVLKNIRLKERIISSEQIKILQNAGLDTSSVSNILINGKVDFSASNTKLDSCKLYAINGLTSNNKTLQLKITNCKHKAKIESLSVAE